jgi:hypothetical protein
MKIEIPEPTTISGFIAVIAVFVIMVGYLVLTSLK